MSSSGLPPANKSIFAAYCKMLITAVPAGGSRAAIAAGPAGVFTGKHVPEYF
jgi:hypothetical protein